MDDCLFCKIVKGEIPTQPIYQTETIYAFKDINPQAPSHILIIPKKHIDRIENFPETDKALAGEIILAAKAIAKQENLKEGYRLVFNNGKDGGQEVEHVHLHLLGGRSMQWPPG